MSENRDVFKIGIAMAGAVSAGAYTAGVIDYLLESLSKWEQAKEENRRIAAQHGKDHESYDPSIPMHDVIIEVMGGASAGGMTSAVTALALFEGIRPINEHNPKKESNRLYDCWVNLNDQFGQGKESTLMQMLDNEDIFENDGVVSILNSTPIDDIAKRAMSLSRVTDLPDYVSKNLEVILTITTLRSIPLAINFFDEQKKTRSLVPPKPAHKMDLHKGVAHFRVETEDDGLRPRHILPFNPHSQTDKESLLNCAIATGAFPLGLKPRYLKGTPISYVHAMVERMFTPPRQSSDYDGDLQPTHGIRIDTTDQEFNFVAVDGGTVNNEPFGEVIRVLEEKCAADDSDYAIIMIDPFPNFEKEEEIFENPNPKVIELVPDLIGALRGQAMMKESDLVRGLSEDYTRKMIFPSKPKADNPDERDPYPIACGSLDGFGGFFSQKFREHDFELGRKNCQSFLRNYFCIPVNKKDKVKAYKDWTPEDPRHIRFFSEPANGYPIVPDMTYNKAKYGDNAFRAPVTPKISAEDIFGLEKKLKTRLFHVLSNINKYDKKEPTVTQRKIRRKVEKLMKGHYNRSTWKKFKSDIFSSVFKSIWKYYGASSAAGILTKEVIRAIISDFTKRRLLEDKTED